jgi:hypothetical protein
MAAQFVLGQTFNFSDATLAGNTDNIKTVERCRCSAERRTADKGRSASTLSPRERRSRLAAHAGEEPVDVMLDPGNYVVDVTMTG